MIAEILFGFVPLLIWLYLLLGRDFFWLFAERDEGVPPPPCRLKLGPQRGCGRAGAQ